MQKDSFIISLLMLRIFLFCVMAFCIGCASRNITMGSINMVQRPFVLFLSFRQHRHTPRIVTILCTLLETHFQAQNSLRRNIIDNCSHRLSSGILTKTKGSSGKGIMAIDAPLVVLSSYILLVAAPDEAAQPPPLAPVRLRRSRGCLGRVSP